MRATGWTDLGLICFTIGLAQYERAKVNVHQPWLWPGWLACLQLTTTICATIG
jgi:hypothetical protein